MKKMKKSTLTIIIVASVVGIIVIWMIAGYNSLVKKEVNVEGAWAQVETQYQRRADLIPNLVTTVKSFASLEQQTILDATAARANAVKQMKIDPNNVTKEQLAAYQAAQEELGRAKVEVMAIAENYPALTSGKEYEKLLDQLEGTENRIAYARTMFNNTTKEYNASIRRFPNNILAGMFGFSSKPFFEADAGAEKAVKVEF